MEIKDMIWNGLMNAEYQTRLKELKKGEYFKWKNEDPDSQYKPYSTKSIFKKGSYDRSQKKYECREYLWQRDGNSPSMYNTIPVDDNEWLGMTRQKRIYLEGSTLVDKNPQY
tara:strand:+ start:2301 stop:2636 length:336 start_codon:yes stop_codon:yes gene_type:complete